MIEGFVWRFPARVQRVYDGDTVYQVDIDQGYLTHRAASSVSDRVERVPLLDLWCPEIRSRDPAERARGLAAKEFAETLLPPGTILARVGLARASAPSAASSSPTGATTPR